MRPKKFAHARQPTSDATSQVPSFITNQPVDLTTTDLGDMPATALVREIQRIRLEHEKLLDLLKIYRIAEPGIPYLRWEFPADEQSLSKLWQIFRFPRGRPPNETFACARQQSRLVSRLQPVFVEHHNGLYFGRWAADLSWPERIRALAVQMFGSLYVMRLEL